MKKRNHFNGLSVAAKVVLPLSLCNPTPSIILNHNQVNFVQNKAIGSTQLFPIGLTKGSEGKDMAELFDMTNCGRCLWRL
jgi:dihydroorotase